VTGAARSRCCLRVADRERSGITGIRGDVLVRRVCPAGCPQTSSVKLNSEIGSAFYGADVKERSPPGSRALVKAPDQFARYVGRKHEMAKVVKDSGAKAE